MLSEDAESSSSLNRENSIKVVKTFEKTNIEIGEVVLNKALKEEKWPLSFDL